MSLVVGDTVQIQDLSNRADLNGSTGRLLQPVGDRWLVRLDDHGSVKVRSVNLRRTQGASEWSRQRNAEAVKLKKLGDLDGAEEIWTMLLDVLVKGSDLETLKVLYSNRSASRLQRGSAAEALEDGEKCVKLDPTWEKGWLRKIDALEALGEVVRAYDVALDGCKCLNHDSFQQIEERRRKLESMPETQGFLQDNRPKQPFCCACGTVDGQRLVKCEECKMVSYCDSACQVKDADAHGYFSVTH